MLCLPGKTLFHLSQQILFQHALCNEYHIFKSHGVGDAVADDDGFGYAENRNASVLLKIKALKMFIINIASFGEVVNTFGQF